MVRCVRLLYYIIKSTVKSSITKCKEEKALDGIHFNAGDYVYYFCLADKKIKCTRIASLNSLFDGYFWSKRVDLKTQHESVTESVSIHEVFHTENEAVADAIQRKYIQA